MPVADAEQGRRQHITNSTIHERHLQKVHNQQKNKANCKLNNACVYRKEDHENRVQYERENIFERKHTETYCRDRQNAIGRRKRRIKPFWKTLITLITSYSVLEMQQNARLKETAQFSSQSCYGMSCKHSWLLGACRASSKAGARQPEKHS